MFEDSNLEKIKLVIKESETLNEVFKKLNLNSSGNNYKVIKRYIQKHNIDLSHFLNKSEHTRRLHTDGKLNKKSNEDIFIKNSLTSRSTVKQRIISENLIEYKCLFCGNIGEWMGNKISLILDHKNGVNNDNRLINLRFLCPNCNSTLDTHCKGSIGLIKKVDKRKKYFEDKNKKYEDSQRENIIKVIESDIDFNLFGWVGKVSKLINISPQKINKWMKRFLPELYEKAFKRKISSK